MEKNAKFFTVIFSKEEEENLKKTERHKKRQKEKTNKNFINQEECQSLLYHIEKHLQRFFIKLIANHFNVILLT
jgi:hypothetical protein